MRSAGTARIWSRQRKDLTAQFPDIAAAAVAQLPDGVAVFDELTGGTCDQVSNGSRGT